eukprot:scaffold3752_cov117-Isochrysis_galbana.AAC.7
MGWGGVGYLFTRGRGGPLWLESVPYLLPVPAPGRAPTVTPHGLGFGGLALLWAVRVGRRALWVRWRDFFQMLPMVPGWAGGS